MVQKDTRPRGRPRGFDELEALEKATQVFLVEGLRYFERRSTILVGEMGLGRPRFCRCPRYVTLVPARVLRIACRRSGAWRCVGALLSPQTLRLARRLPEAH